MAAILRTLILIAWSAAAATAAAAPVRSNGLEPIDTAAFDVAFAKLSAKGIAYRSVIVDPLDVWYVASEPDERHRAWLRSRFDDALSDALVRQGFEVVTEARHGTMRIRPQIIDLRLQRVDRSVAGIDSRYAFDIEPGRMTLVLAIADAVSGELIAQIADLDDQPLAAATHLAELAVADWTEALAATLPELGGDRRSPQRVAAR